MDNLVRMGLREEVGDQEPSPGTRESLLAAAGNNAARSALGPAIPPLVNGLRDANVQVEALQRWWETERLHLHHHNDFSLWDNPWQTPGLVHSMLYHDARRCRFERVTS